MEPSEKPLKKNVRYSEFSHVIAVAEDNGHWYFEAIGNRWWIGPEPPDLAPGDRVRITIQKEVDRDVADSK